MKKEQQRMWLAVHSDLDDLVSDMDADNFLTWRDPVRDAWMRAATFLRVNSQLILDAEDMDEASEQFRDLLRAISDLREWSSYANLNKGTREVIQINLVNGTSSSKSKVKPTKKKIAVSFAVLAD